MLSLIHSIRRTHATIFAALERATDGWLPGLAARFVFASVLFGYYWNSALTKIGEGPFGFLDIQAGAYYQIALPAYEAAGYDAAAVPFIPWGAMVIAGTYAEFLLPLFVVLGLFSRLSALGMIGFIAVQSIVDVTIHKLDAESVGAMFDRLPDGLIFDQRLLWILPLLIVVLKGAGAVSLDRAIGILLGSHSTAVHANTTRRATA